MFSNVHRFTPDLPGTANTVLQLLRDLRLPVKPRGFKLFRSWLLLIKELFVTVVAKPISKFLKGKCEPSRMFRNAGELPGESYLASSAWRTAKDAYQAIGVVSPWRLWADFIGLAIGHPLTFVAKYPREACILYVVPAVALGVLVYTDFYTRMRLRSMLVDVANLFLSKGRRPEYYRGPFMEMDIVQANTVVQHTHGVAAANRSSAVITATGYAQRLGLRPFFEQRSRSDERNDRVGNRVPFWAKDLAAKCVFDEAQEGDLRVLIDVDEYMDMNAFLGVAMPTLLYTFAPTAVAKRTENYSYTFNEDNQVTYEVTGGGSYQHHVWNYSVDTLKICNSFLGIPYRTTFYNVDRRRMDEDHELILLSPIASYWGLGSLIMSSLLSGTPLERMSVNVGGMARLRVSSAGQHLISTGHFGQYTSATIPGEIDDAISNTSKTNKTELSNYSVEGFLSCSDSKQAKGYAAILTAFHRSNLATPAWLSAMSAVFPTAIIHALFPRFKPCDHVHPISESVRRYQYGNLNPDAKPSMEAFMNPIVSGAFAPDLTKENEERAVVGRIVDVASKAATTPFLDRCMNEFLEFYVPKPHTLVPVGLGEVEERQNRPTQRTLREAAENAVFGTARKLKCFLKREAYAKPSDPRIISTYNTRDKTSLSQYMYSEAEHLKTQRWYLFGKTPLEVAKAVTTTCQNALTGVAKTDFSRFDGTISPALRDFEERSMMRKFHPRYHEELRDLITSNKNLKAILSLGTRYDQGTARGSGSADTSVRNTEDNAFIAYVGYRCTKIGGEFVDPQSAYTLMERGVYGGDDGIIVDIDRDAYLKGCKMLGVEVKLEIVPVGKPGVQVLSRCYSSDVWTGDTNSCCDIKRQLSKLHVTTIMPAGVSPAHKLIEKARSLVCTDANTPVIGSFALQVVAFADGIVTNVAARSLRSHAAVDDAADRYPNDCRDWAYDLLREQIPSFDESRYMNWLDSCTCVEDMLHAPLCAEIEPASPGKSVLYVDGEIIQPAAQTAASVPVGRVSKGPKRVKRSGVKPNVARPRVGA